LVGCQRCRDGRVNGFCEVAWHRHETEDFKELRFENVWKPWTENLVNRMIGESRKSMPSSRLARDRKRQRRY
jgi:hypothetical protein